MLRAGDLVEHYSGTETDVCLVDILGGEILLIVGRRFGRHGELERSEITQRHDVTVSQMLLRDLYQATQHVEHIAFGQ